MLDALKPLRHDDLEDHWHLEDLEDVIIEDIEGIESIRQQSVGIDIGSSTSHLIFSELTLRRESNSGRYVVAGRRMLHRSAILLTPYVSPTQIDADRLHSFIDRSYDAAGMSADDVDTGAVVITGEALKKENARPILEMFSKQVGRFICASAGPNHEALLSAHGSGAVALSRENHWRMLVVDMGGGTTKFALIDNGQVLQTAAISIGARLIAFGDDDALTRVEEPARIILGRDDSLQLGQAVSQQAKEALVERMADCLFQIILGQPYSALTDELMITSPLLDYTGLQEVDRIMFSGGVSEYVYGRDHASYGDLGPMFGRTVRQRIAALNRPDVLAPSEAGIRATVIGAGEYTVQASGTTSYIGNRDLLPVYALQVVKPDMSRLEDFEAAIFAALKRIDLEVYTNGLALAITLPDELSYPYLRKVTEGIAAATRRAANDFDVMFVVLDKDVARTLGGILKEELGLQQELITIDGIDVGDLDYVDIGRPIGTSMVMPVTVKSLIFPTKIKI